MAVLATLLAAALVCVLPSWGQEPADMAAEDRLSVADIESQRAKIADLTGIDEGQRETAR